MANIRLILAYDGTDFVGWQIQPEGRTVQGELENAIRELTGESVRVIAAGRTDSGVHALGQVANFHVESGIEAAQWRGALQSKLPPDVVVLDSRAAEDEFHATWSARSKRYRYLIRLAKTEDPFQRRYAWRMNVDLDIGAMRSAAEAVLGTHDFRCFESHWPNKATSVRTVRDVRFESLARWPGWSEFPVEPASREAAGTEFVSFEIEADGFLYNMVRAIVGTLVEVGLGKRSVESMQDVIQSQDRSRAGETAPAHGLYLVRVDYGEQST